MAVPRTNRACRRMNWCASVEIAHNASIADPHRKIFSVNTAHPFLDQQPL
jgi:hypothetical protein